MDRIRLSRYHFLQMLYFCDDAELPEDFEFESVVGVFGFPVAAAEVEVAAKCGVAGNLLVANARREFQPAFLHVATGRLEDAVRVPSSWTTS